MRTAQLNFNVVVKNAILRLRLWCSETKQIMEFDDLCRYIVEVRFVYPCQPLRVIFWLCGGARGEVFVRLIVKVERYLEPEDLTADSGGSSDSTFSDDAPDPRLEFQSWSGSLLMLSR
eukprot:4362330-Pleurochrysis_carterae.AAC.1